MSENNHAALALFAECDSLLQNLSLTDESALSGGGRALDRYMEKKDDRPKKKLWKKRRR